MTMPAWSSPSPNSRAEHSMPSLWMPRIGFGSITRPSGIAVPGVASGTMSPACMLNAPHHTCRSRRRRCRRTRDAPWRRRGDARCARTLGGDDAVDGRADVDDLLDCQAEVGHRRGEAVDVVAERGEVVEP